MTTYPKEYAPIQGYMYQLFTRCKGRRFEHCDYAKDKQEKDYLLNEYRMAYGQEFVFKVVEFPKKYWKEIKLETYKVVDYFDVWGNEKDGWQVNNLATIGEIKLKDYTDVKEILKKLKKMDYLASHVRTNMFDVYNDYDFIEFSRTKNGKPIFRLERKY